MTCQCLRPLSCVRFLQSPQYGRSSSLSFRHLHRRFSFSAVRVGYVNVQVCVLYS